MLILSVCFSMSANVMKGEDKPGEEDPMATMLVNTINYGYGLLDFEYVQ